MRHAATATEYVAGLMRRPAAPARVLGRFDTACYLELADGSVLAVLTADAVQLPIGLTVAGLGRFPDVSAAVVGDGRVQLGPLSIEAARVRSARLRPAGLPQVPAEPSPLLTDPEAAVATRLGRGPGLTPAGDDELCGALAGLALFGTAGSRAAEFDGAEPDGARLREAVLARLTDRRATTSLSAALLRRAVAGDGLPELQRLGEALCGRGSVAAATEAVLRIGHSSGAALAAGLHSSAGHLAARTVAA